MEFFKSKQFLIGASIIGGLLLSLVVFFAVSRDNDKVIYHDIFFDSDGGSKVISQTVLEGGKVTEPINPELNGYTFMGWYLDGEKYDFDEEVHDDITLKAKWKKDGNTSVDDEKEESDKEEDKDDEKENTETNKPNNNVVNNNQNNNSSNNNNSNNNQNNNSSNNNNNNNNNKPEEPKEEPEKPSVIEVTSVSLNNSSLSLKVGESSTLTATVNPSNATDSSVTWSSSDNSVVTVSNGSVQAVGEGSATITVSAGGKSATCTVTVTKNITYSYEMVDVPSSAIGQCYIYINSSEGERVSGTINIVYINGESETVDVPTSGVMKVKSTISSISIVSAG